jgi:hypothetical protein
MKRITKNTQAIADAHIAARIANKFDNPVVHTHEEFVAALHEGKTFERAMNFIEIRFCSVSMIILARSLAYESESYKRGVYKGFKSLLDN